MIQEKHLSARKIGVFDSGMGGLTVLRELNLLFPNDSFIYLGDTARLPYGTKSRETVIKYSESLARVLLGFDVDAIVVACNTASTHALDAVTHLAAPIPVIGMIEPAAKEAVSATRNHRVGVIATTGTIQSAGYANLLNQLDPEIVVSSVACQMLVALAEEGWSDFDDPIARSILLRYLSPVFDQAHAPDTLILGCTHFPVFSKIITDLLGDGVALINSGAAAAKTLVQNIGSGASNAAPDASQRMRFFATDDPARFARNSARFFDHHLEAHQVELIDVSYAASEDKARQAMSRRQNPSGQSNSSTAA